MIDIIVLASALTAGALLYFSGREDFETILSINIQKNILFPIFIIFILISGVFLTEYIHLSETAAHNSNYQQNISAMGCIIENEIDCRNKINNLNNTEYQKLIDGKIITGTFYIPFSLVDILPKNPFTYFCSGILLTWLFFYILFLGVNKHE